MVYERMVFYSYWKFNDKLINTLDVLVSANIIYNGSIDVPIKLNIISSEITGSSTLFNIPNSIIYNEQIIKNDTILIPKKFLIKKIVKSIIIRMIQGRIVGSSKIRDSKIVLMKTQKILDGIITTTEKKLNPILKQALESDMPVSEFQQKYADEVLEFFTNQIRKSYSTGFNYVESSTGIKPEFTSNEDNEIKILARQMFDAFWSNVETARIKNNKIAGSSLFSFIKSLAKFFTTKSINDATMFGVRTVYKEELIRNTIIEYYEFVTMGDDKVCPICEPLDGIIQQPSDILFIAPPIHYNCRCRLYLRYQKQVVQP